MRDRFAGRAPAERRSMDPEEELEYVDLKVRQAAIDEEKTCFDPNTHPKAFNGLADLSEPVADDRGRKVDLMSDTPPVGVELGDSNRNFFDGLPELDDLGASDLSLDELKEVDVV